MWRSFHLLTVRISLKRAQTRARDVYAMSGIFYEGSLPGEAMYREHLLGKESRTRAH